MDPAQLVLFAQQVLAGGEPAPSEGEAPAVSDRPAAKRKGHGRRKLPRNLPRKTVVIEPPPEERRCPCCGEEMTRIGEETSEQIDYIPASLYVIQTIRPKYACKQCPDGTVVTADKPRQPIEKGLPAAGMLAHVIVSKYADHLPLHRLEHIFGRFGLSLSRSTMCGWMGASARLLWPLYELMVERVRSSKVIHTDDTPVPVLDKQQDKTRTGRFWNYRGDEEHPYTVYDYTPSRARDGPAAFLESFEGYLQADAYGGYDGIYTGQNVIEVLCWAHARRKFFQAQSSDPARSAVALGYIRRLYQVERQAKEIFKQQPRDEQARPLSAIRLELRQEQSVPILRELECWLREQAGGLEADDSPRPAETAGPGDLPGVPTQVGKVNPEAAQSLVLPKSPMGVAINYCLGNWEALTRYASDGDLDIDNNASERDLRPVAVGRKNYMFLGSDHGGRTAAVLYSMVASAKRHGLDAFAYLRDVIARISDHPSHRLEDFLPDRWKRASAGGAPGTP